MYFKTKGKDSAPVTFWSRTSGKEDMSRPTGLGNPRPLLEATLDGPSFSLVSRGIGGSEDGEGSGLSSR
jgi:hypothetical protein